MPPLSFAAFAVFFFFRFHAALIHAVMMLMAVIPARHAVTLRRCHADADAAFATATLTPTLRAPHATMLRRYAMLRAAIDGYAHYYALRCWH